MFSICSALNELTQRLLCLQEHFCFLARNFLKKGEEENVAIGRINFSASNDAIRTFFSSKTLIFRHHYTTNYWFFYRKHVPMRKKNTKYVPV